MRTTGCPAEVEKQNVNFITMEISRLVKVLVISRGQSNSTRCAAVLCSRRIVEQRSGQVVGAFCSCHTDINMYSGISPATIHIYLILATIFYHKECHLLGCYSKTSVLTKSTPSHILANGILHNPRGEILKSYIDMTGWDL
jgi:hypothetical protein